MYPLDDSAINALFTCLIWQAPEDKSGPLDYQEYTRDDIPRDQQETLIEAFRDFCYVNAYDVEKFQRTTGTTLDQVAHDFILTRNGHGAGFWDRGAGEVGQRLTDACKPYGEINVYVSDGGTLEIS